MRKTIKTHIAYQIPEIFFETETVNNFLKDCGFDNPSRSIDKLYYYLNHLRVTSHLKRHRYKKDGWVSINIDIARSIYGDIKYFYAIHNKMMELDFVEVQTNENGTASYKPNEYSKKFRLTSILQNMEWRIKRISAHYTTTRKVIIHNEKNYEPIDYKLNALLENILIDEIPFFEYTTVENFIESDYFEASVIRKRANDKLSKESKKYQLYDLNKKMCEIYSAYKDGYKCIKEKAYRYKPDNYGRRHTNITNLPKFLRSYLYFEKRGQKMRLYSVDISNSQVLLLLKVLPSSLSTYHKFKELVEAGKFYQFLSDKLNIEYTEDNKTLIKQQFFCYIYGDPKEPYVWSNKIYKIMMSEFSDVALFIIEFKNEFGFKTLSQRMQIAESSIIIKEVCKTLLKKRILFTQIYDSILCTEQDIKLAKQIMQDAFKANDLNVTLHVNPC